MSKNNYSSLKSQLDELIIQLEDESLDIDESIILYQKSQEIIKQMDIYLKKSEAKIKKITGS